MSLASRKLTKDRVSRRFVIALICWTGPALAEGVDPTRTTYSGILDGPVTLTDGRYEGAPYVEGGAIRPVVKLLASPRAAADLDGDGHVEQAVLLVADLGGSGTFVYLAMIPGQSIAGRPVPAVFVGDRVRVSAIEIVTGEIRVEFLDFAPGDAMCCPTLRRRAAWVLREGELLALE